MTPGRGHRGSEPVVPPAGAGAILPAVIGAEQAEFLEHLYTRLHREARALSLTMLHDEHLAQDAVHQAFLQIIRSLALGDLRVTTSEPRALLLRNTRWAALKLLRRGRRHRGTGTEAVPLETDDVRAWVRTEARLLCETLLAGLSPRHQAVLRCRYVEGLPDARAALRLGITVKAYRRRLDRALDAIRRRAGIVGLHPLVAALSTMRRRIRRRVAGHHAGGAGSAGRTLAAIGPLLLSGGTWAMIKLAPAPSAAMSPAVTVAAGSPLGASMTPGETVDDTLLLSAAVAEHAPTPTVVAIGRGQRCHCQVLLRSLDGGGTWQAAPAPARGTEVVLPPEYPADPRIFVADGALAPSPDSMSSAFGRPFRDLPLPPGPLSLDPAFDAGRPRLLVAGSDALWSYDLRTQRSTRVPLGSDAPRIAAIASPITAAANGPVVIAAIDNRGDSAHGRIADAGAHALRLVACSAALHCTPLGTLPLTGDVRLMISPRYAVDHTVVVWQPTALAASADGGATFHLLQLPAGLETLTALTWPVASPTHSLWAVGDAGGVPAILRAPAPSGGWRGIGTGGDLIAQYGQARGAVVPVTGLRLLYLLPYGGMACSTDGGASWSRGCPPTR